MINQLTLNVYVVLRFLDQLSFHLGSTLGRVSLS